MIGDLTQFPDDFLSAGPEMESATYENNKFSVYLVFGYAGTSELSHITMRIQKEITLPTKVTPELIEKFTYMPHCDSVSTLTIRTSGHKRLSGFLPWQNAFSTMYFLDKMWPEFSDCDMFKAIFYFQRNRNKCSKAADFEDVTKLEQLRSNVNVC